MSTTYEEQRTEQEKVIDAEVLARVRRGLAWLEETHGPGWEDKIDMEVFDIRDCSVCVLGQVYGEEARQEGEWWDGYDYARLKLPHRKQGVENLGSGIAFGFNSNGDSTAEDGSDEPWQLLQEAWEFVLRPRVERT